MGMEHDIVKHNRLWRTGWIAEDKAISKGTDDAWQGSRATINDLAHLKVEQGIGRDKEPNDRELKTTLAESRYS